MHRSVKRLDIARKRRLIQKAQKAGVIDALPEIIRTVYSYNKQRGMVQRLRSRNG
jgi:hypothetical protein